jgi:hypothetical protein
MVPAVALKGNTLTVNGGGMLGYYQQIQPQSFDLGQKLAKQKPKGVGLMDANFFIMQCLNGIK